MMRQGQCNERDYCHCSNDNRRMKMSNPELISNDACDVSLIVVDGD